MDKITDFGTVSKYFCTKHNRFHFKYRYEIVYVNGYPQNKIIRTKSFEQCKEHAVKLSQSELWNWQFKKSWKRYNLDEAKEHHKIKR